MPPNQQIPFKKSGFLNSEGRSDEASDVTVAWWRSKLEDVEIPSDGRFPPSLIMHLNQEVLAAELYAKVARL